MARARLKKLERSRALRGKTVLVTRARKQAKEFLRLLQAKGAKVVEVPLIEIGPPPSQKKIKSALLHIANFDWLILTSVNGVEAMFEGMRKLRIPVSRLRGLRMAAIGPATRAAIEKKGLRVTVTPKEYVAEAVVKALRARIRDQRVLLLRAAVARDVIPRELRKAGADVTVVAAYETKVPAGAQKRLRALLGKQPPEVITFTSSSTVHNFARLAGTHLYSGALDGTAFASIGPVTSDTLREHGLHAEIEAREYNVAGLARAVESWARKKKS